jgi:hypothetical protein
MVKLLIDLGDPENSSCAATDQDYGGPLIKFRLPNQALGPDGKGLLPHRFRKTHTE